MTAKAVTQPGRPQPVQPLIALFVLFGTGVIELVLNRLPDNLGLYVVTTGAPLSIMAQLGRIGLLFTGTLAFLLLLVNLVQLINHPLIPGFFWRGVLIFIAPAFLLITAWSIWQPLASWLLAASITSVIIMIVVLTLVTIRLPLPRRIGRLVFVLGLAITLGIFAFATLDFVGVNRLSGLGRFALNAYQFAEILLLLSGPFALVVWHFDSWEKFKKKLLRPHLPALFIALVVAMITGEGIRIVQQAGGGQEMGGATPLLVRLAYRTFGMTLSFPAGPLIYPLFVFCIVLLLGTSFLPFGPWRPNGDSRLFGLGLGFIYMSGLQPLSVYQAALTLLGFCLLTTALARRWSDDGRGDMDDMMELLDQLDEKESP